MSAEALSEPVTELSQNDWLTDHHVAKLPQRRQMIADLAIEDGARILDVGCGPGLWSDMLAEAAGPNATITGLDLSEDLLAVARARVADAPWAHKTRFQQGDLFNLPFEAGAFDLTFMANCAVYFPDKLAILREQMRVTAPGGRLVSKDFDGGAWILNPIDSELVLKVLSAAAAGLAARGADDYFDNFCGKKMPGLFRAAGLQGVRFALYPFVFQGPLSPEARRFHQGIAAWFADAAAPGLAPAEARAWRAAFSDDSPDCILDHPDFLSCMVETVTSGSLRRG